MRKVALGDSGLYTSVLGFGCSALMGRSGRRESLGALAAAWDHGIRLFDTARSYGDGDSERLLGEFLRGRRSETVIGTKFGILPARRTTFNSVAKSIARPVLAAFPSARSFIRKSVPAGRFSGNQFSTTVLRKSIEESLRQLGTDYVDLLFLHEAPASVFAQEDLLEAMHQLVKAGKVRVAGLASAPDIVGLALAQGVEPLRAMEFPCNIFNLSTTVEIARKARGQALMANHPFGGGPRVRQCREMLRALALDPRIDVALREKLAPAEDEVLADVVFSAILRNTGIHAVIPAMMHVQHVKANVRATMNSRFTDAEVAEIRAHLAGCQQPLT